MRIVRIVLIGLLSCLSACGVGPVGGAGPFERKQMESLVSQVRHRPFNGDQEFWWDMVSGSATIVPGPGRPARLLFARRSPEGKLTAVIMTEWGNRDDVQAGFAFFDVPVAEKPGDGGRVYLDVPGDLRASYPEQKIDSHWREVWNDDL